MLKGICIVLSKWRGCSSTQMVETFHPEIFIDFELVDRTAEQVTCHDRSMLKLKK
jgi:hypothetical protein